MMSIAKTKGTYFVLGSEFLGRDLDFSWLIHLGVVVWLPVHLWYFGTF